jgi:hypothetical protein
MDMNGILYIYTLHINIDITYIYILYIIYILLYIILYIYHIYNICTYLHHQQHDDLGVSENWLQWYTPQLTMYSRESVGKR